ncbi:hypothetical protein [Faecalibaculum rodentium]|uniref:hypothetical protein n=1 Tax=Faecalibaculum rodentium TaxID=1702221 RepID=UPI0023F3E0E0|nr:hypothetical protein [Faecalibaculum rodentium]
MVQASIDAPSPAENVIASRGITILEKFQEIWRLTRAGIVIFSMGEGRKCGIGPFISGVVFTERICLIKKKTGIRARINTSRYIPQVTETNQKGTLRTRLAMTIMTTGSKDAFINSKATSSVTMKESIPRNFRILMLLWYCFR